MRLGQASIKRNGHKWLLISLVFITFALIASRMWTLTIDDSYISARYAWNAAHGFGLTFNPGEHVMGYTNLLWVVIQGVAYRLGADGILWSKVVGYVAGLCALVLTAAIGREVDTKRRWYVGWLAAAMLAIYPDLALGAVMGMETALFTTLSLSSLWLFLRYMQHDGAPSWAQGALATALLLSTLTRPEGFGLACFLVIVMLLARRQFPKPQLRILRFSWFGIYLLLLIPVLIWLTSYYGSPIPNTFFAKTASGLNLEKYASGLEYMGWWLNASGRHWLLPFILLTLLQRHKPLSHETLSVWVGLWSVYVVYAGADWMPGHRFLLPVAPLVYILAVLGMVRTWELLQGGLSHLSARSRYIFMLIVLMAPLIPAFSEIHTAITLADDLATGYSNAHKDVAQWLQQTTPTNTTVALMDVGMVGFVSQRKIIDIVGLVNTDVAAMIHRDSGYADSTLTADQVARYVLAQKPDVVVLAHTSAPDAPFVSKYRYDSALFDQREFQQGYQWVFSRKFYVNYYLSIYMRDGLALMAPSTDMAADATQDTSRPAATTVGSRAATTGYNP